MRTSFGAAELGESNQINFVANLTDETLIKQGLNTLFNGNSNGVNIYSMVSIKDSQITAAGREIPHQGAGGSGFPS